MTDTPARIARRAADIMAANGRTRYDFINHNAVDAGVPPTRCPVCPAGAIRLAVCEDYLTETGEEEMEMDASLIDDPPQIAPRVEKALADWLQPHTPAEPLEVIAAWADNHDLPDDHVVAALRAFADDLERSPA